MAVHRALASILFLSCGAAALDDSSALLQVSDPVVNSSAMTETERFLLLKPVTTMNNMHPISVAERNKILSVTSYGYGKGPAKDVGAFSAEGLKNKGFMSYYHLNLPGLQIQGQRDPHLRWELLGLDMTGKTYLDVGTNMGGMIFAVADKIKWGVGLDFDNKMINIGSRISRAYKMDHVGFYQIDLQQDDLNVIPDFLPAVSSDSWPNKVGSVDVASLFGVNMWIKNWKETIVALRSHSKHLVMEINWGKEGPKQYMDFMEKVCKKVVYVPESKIHAACKDCNERKLLHCYK